ncbi:RIP metalloprotease RseP [Arenicella xantha]|uniref:Zinc metalloprotease n=1 Tax=Arenicella xantha TaxID=644221 RepID=A0A395JJN6_9GAMM|nr:RIP metalloprotease RseP [Arenicella xantha]RBP50942.1 regulator of sigma E protease [Arenicella xantha]
MGIVYSAVGFMLAIGILVTVHEFGHFWVARKLGVKVLRFSVGFGKPLWKRVSGPDNTEYVLAAIPLGGYVKMLGENDPDTPVQANEAHRAFDNQPIWKRSLIVAAGPGINFLFAILLFALIGLPDSQRLVPVFGEPPVDSPLATASVAAGDRLLSVDGRSYQYYAEHDLYIFNQVLQKEPIQLSIESAGQVKQVTLATDAIPIYNINPASLMAELGFNPIEGPSTREIAVVNEGSPAALAGLQVGDEITAIDGQAVLKWSELTQAVFPKAGVPIMVTVARGDASVDVSVTPAAQKVGDKVVGLIGVQRPFIPRPAEHFVTVSNSPLQALENGVTTTWLMSSTIVRMLGKMVTLQVSLKNVNGPIMIADVAGQVIQVGLEPYLYFLALISISLGVMNLLPMPMLDGGHLLRFAIETVAGRRLSEKVYLAIQPLGLLMLVGLMSLAFYNDILMIFN